MPSNFDSLNVGPAESGDQERKSVRKSSRLLAAIVAMVVMVGFTVIVVYAYNQGIKEGSEEAAPVLRAEGPSKVPPESPGGLEIPHQDKLVYNLIGKQQQEEKVERLLPPPEVPLPKVVATKPPAAPVPVLPPKLSFSIDGTNTKQSTVVQPNPIVSESAVSPPVSKEKKTTQQPATQRADEAATQVSAHVSSLQDAAKREFRIQIASMKNPAAAYTEWERRVGQHKDLLGAMTLFVDRVSVPGRGIFHRVQAGPILGRAAASTLCDKLKQRKVGCLVVRP